MNVRTPATSFIAAVDEPWRFLRRAFPLWAPAAFALAAVGAVPALITQWFSGALYASPEAGAFDFAALAGVYAGSCGALVMYVASQLGAFVIAARALDGERAGVWETLLGAFSPRMLLLGGSVLAFVLLGFGCIVGGPLLAGVFAFVPALVVARPGVWFPAVNEAIVGASRRASPVDAGAPMWKLAALATIWYGVYSVTNQTAAMPSVVWVVWHLVSTLGQGDIAQALQMQPPFAIGAFTALAGALLRPFADLYFAAGVTILWRDLARVREGADLEALVSAEPA